MRLLVVDEVALEGGHAALVEQGRVGTAPKIPEVVDGILLVFGVRVGILAVGQAHHGADVVEQVAALGLLAVDIHLHERAVLVEGN